MFQNKRYITSGINEEVSIELQSILWNLIDKLKESNEIELDYLQVFQLRHITQNDEFNQSIIYAQEVPPHKNEYLHKVEKPINTRIYIIDDSQNSLMMKNSEY